MPLFTTRPASMSLQGMVASPHYLASQAGLAVLQRGGSAIDALIAVNSTLAVVYPHMTGVGGDAFWLIYDADARRVMGLNASGRAALGARRDFYRERGHSAIPQRGPLAALTVPGTVDGWCEAHARYGRLPLASDLEQAIDYATQGYPTSQGQSRWTAQHAEMLRQYPHTARVFLPGGLWPKAGSLSRQPELGQTLRAIAQGGRDAFYRGEVAARIVHALASVGGLLTREDFAAHRCDWVVPICTTYRGYTAYQMPPNTQGLAALLILNILEGLDVAGLGEGTAAYYHACVEATKLAFVDRNRYVSDPSFVDIPLERLLSKEHAARRRSLLRPDAALPPDQLPMLAGDTTFSCAVDRFGNAASMIQSLYFEWGSGFVAGDTGVLLQNRGCFFSLDDASIQRLEPGKRPFHTLIPALLCREGRPYLVYGTMGGEGQPQTQTALVTRIIDFGMDVQAAIDAPRWLFGRTWGEESSELRIEGRVPEAVRAELVRLGHAVRVLPAWSETMGHAQAIRIDPETGVLSGGADPRGEGCALGW